MAGLRRRIERTKARSSTPAPARKPRPVDADTLRVLRTALVVSVALFMLRLAVSSGTGFGDAEALYASYALHPQPVYLDHPGLIGFIARLLGAGGAPSPARAHVFTTVVATLFPWLGALAARAAGASWRGAFRTVIGLALVPEFAIGLYAFAPELPLAVAWMGALALAAVGLRAKPGSNRAMFGILGAGVLVGLSCLSQASGVLLGLALFIAFLAKPGRAHFRTPAPWVAMLLVGILIAPAVRWEAHNGYPLLHHRLVATQAHAGLSLRNLGALVGGQLLYVTPPFLIAAWFLLRDVWKTRKDDPVSHLLWIATVVPGAALVVLCLWSRVAEPHWLAPAYLPLGIQLGRSDVVGRKLALGSVITGAAIAALAWVWIKTDLPIELMGSHYRARYDLANDLYTWGPARQLLDDAVETSMIDSAHLPVVVGPHWVVCAQAQAAVGNKVPVGCNTPMRDDFDRWYPRKRWLDAPVILYVTDSRFHIDPEKELPNRTVKSISRVAIRRGGHVVRTVRIIRLDKASDVGLLHRPTRR
jgi:hypothetical protein